MALLNGNLELFVTFALIALIAVLVLIFFRTSKKSEEWERRIIVVVMFFAIHELAFFLDDPFISQLTEILFIFALLYALLYVFSFEKKIKHIEKQRKEFLRDLEEIRNLKEIREKLKK